MTTSAEKRRRSRRRGMRAELTTGFDTAEFDRDFWASVSSEERLAAGWQLAADAHLHRGGKKSELRLQRSVVLLKRGPG